MHQIFTLFKKLLLLKNFLDNKIMKTFVGSKSKTVKNISYLHSEQITFI